MLYPFQFPNEIKVIAISMYMKDIFNTNYDKDDGQYLSGFLKYLSKKKKRKKQICD